MADVAELTDESPLEGSSLEEAEETRDETTEPEVPPQAAKESASGKRIQRCFIFHMKER
jgi:hypothetical protein